jgi:two-component system, NarL family, sensor histidine kinase DegS
MKRKMTVLSRQYEAALGEYLKSRSNSTLKKAGTLGTDAVLLGLETLDLAKMHEQALIAIGGPNPSDAQDGLAKRAQTFFVEANVPIERTHLAAAKANLHWSKLNERLHERTSELAISKRDVKSTMVQRKAAEESLRTRNESYGKLLKESKSMQESLRGLTHRVLSAQESERGKISRELHDEIAQILLGINVRLLTLQQKGSLDAEKLLKDIASTQQIVDKSIQTMRRAARKFQTPQ